MKEKLASLNPVDTEFQDSIFKDMDKIKGLLKKMKKKFPNLGQDGVSCLHTEVDDVGEFASHEEDITLKYDTRKVCEFSIHNRWDGKRQVYSIYENGFVLNEKHSSKSIGLEDYSFVAWRLESMLSDKYNLNIFKNGSK